MTAESATEMPKAEKKIEDLSDLEKLQMVREGLPYQYAAIIGRKLADKGISAQQVRLVFYRQITDPAITVPVLFAALALREEVLKSEALLTKATTKQEAV